MILSLRPTGDSNMHWLNPDHLPHVTSNVERFLVNVHGEIDGIILANGLEVHSPPHLSEAIRAAIQLGDHITVRGVRPRSADMITAVAIDKAPDTRIIDDGPELGRDGKGAGKHARPPKHSPMNAQGTVRRILHGPKGEARGVLLEDGICIRFPPHEAQRLAPLLSIGTKLAARGKGLESPFGTVIEAQEIGASGDDLQAMKHKKPKHDKHHKPDKPAALPD
jgi:hypothetical protein